MPNAFQFTNAVAALCGGSARAWMQARGVPARINARLTRGMGSPRAFIGRLGLITTCVTVLLPPIAFAALSAIQLQQRADEQATLGARHLEVQLRHTHAVDWLNRVSINVLHASRVPNSVVVASWVTDKDGRALTFQGGSVAWPEFTARTEIKAPAFEGYFNIALSTRDVILETFYVAVAFLVLGLAAHHGLWRLPLTALDDAQGLLEAKQGELLSQKSQLEMQNLRFDAALNNMSQGLCMFDGARRLVVCNTPYARMYGMPPELAKPGTLFDEIIRRRVSDEKLPPQYIAELERVIADNRPTTKIRDMTDGRTIAIRHQPMPGGGWVATHEDVTEYRRIEARIAHMAHHDVLTELPNRVLLRERLERALEGARKGRSLAVLCLDLDRFKDINDTLGHSIGDALLKAVAHRLATCVGEADTVARLGGDEFAIVQIDAEQPVAATALATRVIEALGQPFDLGDHQVVVGASIGIDVPSGEDSHPDQLLKNADLALYRAKGEGRGIHRFFEPAMDAHMQARCKLQLDLRKALANGEFELYYQPLVNLARDEISCFEALMRWNHPERGRVSPGEFIPLAEETGLIVPMGEWALRQACAAAATWPEHIKVAINLSAVQFKSRHLVDTVFSTLATSGLSPGRLELEITESVLLQDDDATLATLHQLRALGVRIALDDFGTGYSSLSYLRSFPFDKIKIDRCFVTDLSRAGDDSLAILRAVAGLGTSLGIATTAEGVETEEQLARVRQEGCTEMQGFLFSPPVPVGEIARLLPRKARAVSAA